MPLDQLTETTTLLAFAITTLTGQLKRLLDASERLALLVTVVVGLGLALLVWGALVLHWDALAKAWDLVVLYVLGSTGGQGAYHALRWRRDRPANDASPGGQDGA